MGIMDDERNLLGSNQCGENRSSGPVAHERLLEPTGRDGQCSSTAGCTRAMSGLSRRRRLLLDHRPQERPDHQGRRKYFSATIERRSTRTRPLPKPPSCDERRCLRRKHGAFVALKPGRQATAEEIIEHCKTKLTNFFLPREVVFLPALPKNLIGKILKKELRNLLNDWQPRFLKKNERSFFAIFHESLIGRHIKSGICNQTIRKKARNLCTGDGLSRSTDRARDKAGPLLSEVESKAILSRYGIPWLRSRSGNRGAGGGRRTQNGLSGRS